MRRITRLVSFWAFLLFAALVALQVFPYTGVFLMIVGAAFVTGLVLHVFLIALFVEAFVGRLPRYLIAIPMQPIAPITPRSSSRRGRLPINRPSCEHPTPARF